MMEWLQLLLPAWIMGSLLVFLTAPLGCLMLWRRMSFFADTMAHGTLLGVAVAGILHLPFGWAWAVWRHCWLPFYGFCTTHVYPTMPCSPCVQQPCFVRACY